MSVSNPTTISGKDLAAVIRANLNAFDYTERTDNIRRFLERKTGKHITFSSLVIAFLNCGFGVIPHGKEFRLIPYAVEGLVQ